MEVKKITKQTLGRRVRVFLVMSQTHCTLPKTHFLNSLVNYDLNVNIKLLQSQYLRSFCKYLYPAGTTSRLSNLEIAAAAMYSCAWPPKRTAVMFLVFLLSRMMAFFFFSFFLLVHPQKRRIFPRKDEQVNMYIVYHEVWRKLSSWFYNPVILVLLCLPLLPTYVHIRSSLSAIRSTAFYSLVLSGGI